MKKTLIIILLSMMAISLYAFSPEDMQTGQVIHLISLIESENFEEAEAYINYNNIESSVLSYYLVSSGVVPYSKDHIAPIYRQHDEYISELYSERLRFLLDNGANPMQFVFGKDDPLSIVDAALFYLLSGNQGAYSSKDWLIWQQLRIISEYEETYTARKSFNFYFENFLKSHRCNYYILGAESKLIPYIEFMLELCPIEPSENILSVFYVNEWYGLFGLYADKWIEDECIFSAKFINTIAESLKKLRLEDRKPRPEGILPILLRMGYDFSSDDYSLLFNSMIEGMPIDDVKYIIKETNAWNARNRNGETLLMYASAFYPGIEYIEFLLNGGADINRIGGLSRETALIFAVKEYAPLDNIKYLLAHGADITLTDKDGNNAVLAVFHEISPSSHIPFNNYWMGDNEFYNFVKGYMCPLISMLIEADAEINAMNKYNQNVAIKIAMAKPNAYFNDYALFDLLYDSGVDFSTINTSKKYKLVNDKLVNYFYDRGLEEYL